MRNLLNPKWIFVINTLPLIVLFFLFVGQFNIIHSLLDEESIRIWTFLACVLGALGVANLSYGLYLIIKRKNVSFVYGFLALVFYISFLYLYSYHAEDMLPFTVPQWMVPKGLPLYPGTFLMPTLIYSLFILVVHFTPANKEHKAWVNFVISVNVPVVWYLFSQLVLPFWRPVDTVFNIHALIIFVIAGTLIFLFFLIRGVFIVASKKADAWKKYELFWKIPVSLLLPLIGLAINNGYLFKDFGMGDGGVFGDFNHPSFYILTIINAIVICLPNRENKMYRILLFIGRCITFAFTSYFFIVFLPFLPLSVVAIVAVGAGFLMLAPLLLFIIHVNELSNDFKFLKNYLSNKLLISIASGGFLFIPFFITLAYFHDRNVLNETLSYVYSPDYSKKYNIDKESLRKTLEVVKHHKDRNGDFISGNQIPYLSSYFNWIVLDNLTLSESKISKIENVFFGTLETPGARGFEDIRNDEVHISNISTKSTFDKSQNAWISWVDMEITNSSDNAWFSEFATTLDLPVGCWISDYYLYVGDKREEGILAEKKAAMWVFSQIRNSNRDPGILHYLTGNKVAFRVFPFAKNEVRRTGIQFLHKEPVKFSIENKLIELGDSVETAVYKKENNPNVIYVTSKEKQSLKKVQRKPYFHFLIDASRNAIRNRKLYTARIDLVLKANKELAEQAQVSFVNTYVNSCKISDGWKEKYNMYEFEGGFFIDRAIRTVLYDSYKTQSDSYPVIVVVTDDFEKVMSELDFSDFKMAFPESDLYFSLEYHTKMHPHSLTLNARNELADSALLSLKNNHVLKYELNGTVAYLPDNVQPEIILRNEFFNVGDNEIREKDWQSALTMQGKWLSQVIHPETSDKEWLNLVKYSFISKVMSPVTSYLVVENEAQKAMLKKKQEQALSGNKSLDLDEDTSRMSEPGLVVLVVLFGSYLWYVERRKRQLKQKAI